MAKNANVRTMGKPKKRKGKIKFKQTYSLVATKNRNNAGNVGHPVLLNNAGNIRISIRRKT